MNHLPKPFLVLALVAALARRRLLAASGAARHAGHPATDGPAVGRGAVATTPTPDLSSPSPTTAPTASPSAPASPSSSPEAPTDEPTATPAPTKAPTGTTIVRAYFFLGSFTDNAGLVPVLREIPKTQAVGDRRDEGAARRPQRRRARRAGPRCTPTSRTARGSSA